MWSSLARRSVGRGGFALHEAVRRRVAGVSDPHVVQFPPPINGVQGQILGVVATRVMP